MKTLGATLLIAGTSIGGGMLALPVLTSLGGFIPSLAVFFLCWLFMASTGLLIVEACLWMDGESNLVSLAEKTLGQFGKVAAWVLYLFLFYTLTVAYVSGCGDLVVDLCGDCVPEWLATLLFVVILGAAVWAGAQCVDWVNGWLMLGLGVSYGAFVWLGWRHVDVELLRHRSWILSLTALPIAFASFGFQGIVPTIVHAMQRDVRKVRCAILIGSFIPLGTYAVWEWLIHGIIPLEHRPEINAFSNI